MGTPVSAVAFLERYEHRRHGLRRGFVLVESNVAVDCRVLRSNGGEVFGCQFDGGDLLGLQQLAGLFEGVLGHKSLLV